jgi:hypothetical protein
MRESEMRCFPMGPFIELLWSVWRLDG